MSVYKVKSPDGRTVTLRGNSPPTDSDLDKIFSSLPPSETQPKAPENKPANMMRAIAGPMSRGVEAVQSGITLQDAPHVLAKMGSDYLSGVPEIVAKNPLAAFMQVGSGIKSRSMFPEAKTKAGEELGRDLGVVSGFLPTSLPARALSSAAKATKSGIMRAVEVGAKEIPPNLQMVKRAGLKQFASRGGVIGKLENVTSRMAQKEAGALKESVLNESRSMSQALNASSREEALQAQKLLPKYYKKHFDAYEKGMESVIAKENPRAPRNEISRALEDSLNELGLRGEHARPPSSPSESFLLDLATDYADIRRAKEIVPTEKIIEISKAVKNSLPKGVSSGKQLYGSGEHAVSVFKENYGKILSKYAKGLNKINSEYAPFFKLKRASNEIFKPYAGEYGTKGAESFLKRAGLMRTKGTVEDILLSDLSKEVGSQIGSKSRKAGAGLESLKESKRLGLERIKESSEQRLLELAARKKKVSRNIGEAVAEGLRKVVRFGSGRII